MLKKHILVTGATGKTSAYTVPLLIECGHYVRAFMHKIDHRSERMKAMGAEIVAGNLLDFYAISDAPKNIDTAYFCYPIEPGLVEATAYFAQGAREAGVKAIVNMSQISARREAKSNAAHRQYYTSDCGAICRKT
ncbi:MAG: NAD(P)H-binding protein [Rhizonema sp. PD38]|nr:NAD(P)H-binding protein [Rhizonema sp. PD38]